MARPYTQVVRGGTVVDGSGGALRDADVGIADGLVAAVEPGLGAGDEEIDARGMIVTPGFIDPHTHYDAQATWSSRITPSSWNGVTTAMMGNCGVGFAPCRPDQRETLVEFMEGVEDIPGAVLDEGLPWSWQSFEQFMDALEARAYDLDIAAQVPHSPVRVFVMGRRGVEREPASAADNAAMAEIAAAGIRAGALGFSTSRTLNHKTLDGRPIPTLTAAEDELAAVGVAMGAVGAGWLQVISDFDDLDGEFAMLRRVVERCRRPMAITILQNDRAPDGWRRLLAHIAEANRAGLPMIGQTLTRATGVLLGFEISMNPFSGRPSWEAIAHLPLAKKVETLRRPGFRAPPLRRGLPEQVARQAGFELGAPLSPRHAAGLRAARREEHRRHRRTCGAHAGGCRLRLPAGAGGQGAPLPAGQQLRGGLPRRCGGDAAPPAHAGEPGRRRRPCGHVVRRERLHLHAEPLGPRQDPGRADAAALGGQRMTRDNALALGLADRGLLQPGFKADLNVIDLGKLTLHCPEPVYDLPGGGRRLIQRAEGYAATLVSGVPVYRDGAGDRRAARSPGARPAGRPAGGRRRAGPAIVRRCRSTR